MRGVNLVARWRERIGRPVTFAWGLFCGGGRGSGRVADPARTGPRDAANTRRRAGIPGPSPRDFRAVSGAAVASAVSAFFVVWTRVRCARIGGAFARWCAAAAVAFGRGKLRGVSGGCRWEFRTEIRGELLRRAMAVSASFVSAVCVSSPAWSQAAPRYLALNTFPQDQATRELAREWGGLHVVHADYPIDWRRPSFNPSYAALPGDDRGVYLGLAPLGGEDRAEFLGSFADYREYCRASIRAYAPARADAAYYVNLGIEADDPKFEPWYDRLLNGRKLWWWTVERGLRAEFPGVKFGVSVRADRWRADSPLVSQSDFVGLSLYPQLWPADLGAILGSTTKPVAICETGLMTFGSAELEGWQAVYVDWLLQLPLEFVVWWSPRDFDWLGFETPWDTVGLMTSGYREKPAWSVWTKGVGQDSQD